MARGATMVVRRGFFDDPAARAAYADLMRDVFDLDVAARDRLTGPDSTCMPFAIFDPTGLCVAAAEAFAVPLLTEGIQCDAVGLRSVGVHPQWRGRGLFRQLMDAILAWCDATHPGPVLLYTEEAALYERFGFRDLPQFRFVGPPPPRVAREGSRPLSLDAELPLIRRLLALRTPVSSHVALDGGASLFLTQVAARSLALDYIAHVDALVVTERDGNVFTLVDIVAATIPSLATILAAMTAMPETVVSLFPPDRLAWVGRPDRDDTGLMIRGPAPGAFDAPFMLPPTAEF